MTKISLSGKLIYGLIAGSILAVLLTLYIIYDYAGITRDRMELSRLRQQTAQQTKEMNELAIKIDQFADRMEEIKQFDKKLRILATEQIGQDAKTPLGIGGSNNDQMRLRQLIEEDREKLVSGMHENIDRLNAEADEREMSFNELLRFLREQKSLLAATPSLWPVHGWVTSEFGMRRNPFGSGGEFHKGIDIASRAGKEIIAPADGFVLEAAYRTDDGNVVKIEHGYGISTSYAHLSKAAVKDGVQVRKGDVIGYVGDTGRSTGAHLHYSVFVNNVPVNPRKYLK
ncbi:MAG: peptidoglycan DD-metalloendopeptidase family protein [Smithellaceae bacterium]|nr:peptidoglycan DD-metalloendopeptidase family protein [Smithellaceae bacterium]MDD3258662.1 peptidoglycan DD-metalloendopeptidase family protein [Smithellaceae bacterium]MDD3848863.1 peptidoglycan DD-metalloendopeptidase family protein [Smithellaceae bacterium]HOG12311.1 peptidoglycan DD-metalloendopeptidase family protein [Smithellaceae bacterium]HOQ71201.1 peptidoglycan DD-metalloendopeptidase family protein [Smithellaceae bacterium]